MTDAFLQSVSVELLSQALFDVAKRLARVEIDVRRRREFIEHGQDGDTELTAALESAVERVTDVPLMDTELGGENLRAFLQSPNCRDLIRQLYICELSESKSAPLSALRRQFIGEYRRWTDVDAAIAKQHGGRLFDVFTSATQIGLAAAVQQNVLAAHDAYSNLRHALVMSRLEDIERNITALQSHDVSAATVSEFESIYRRQVANREGTIVPPNLDQNSKIPIDDLYVPPVLQRGSTQEGRGVSYGDFIDQIDRTVVLGDPGAGKSTLAAKICHDLARYEPRLYRGLALTPVLVTLRDYGVARQEDNQSILDYINSTAAVRYQMSDVPDGSFEYLLRTGRALVIFDGLDELLDSAYRQVISGDVEAFAEMYPATPILVTSRRVGYQQARLDARTFETFAIGKFDDDAVEEYVKKWFGLDVGLFPAERRKKVDGFMRESEIVRDLRSNALMLGLMCNLYGGENYIPANRPDIFEKCAVMLFERWDRSRQIKVEMPFESRLRPAMQHLAHWIYLSGALQRGVTRRALVDEATNYLHPRQFADEGEAREAAGKFVDFCKGRAWVFTDTGLSAKNEPLFQFTHRTFLEYFCAEYLARTHVTPSDLVQLLVPRIEKREWDVVSQLAFQVKTKYVEDAADEMLPAVLARAEPQGLEAPAVNLRLFAARTLEFLVASPTTVEAVTASCVKTAFALVARVSRDAHMGVDTFSQDSVVELLAALAAAGKESWPTVAATLRVSIIAALAGENQGTSITAAELAFHAERIVNRTGAASRERMMALDEMGRDVISVSTDRVRCLAEHDRLIGIDAALKSILPLGQLVRASGCEILFADRHLRVLPGCTVVSILFTALLGTQSDVGDWYWGPRRERSREVLHEVGNILSNSVPPWAVKVSGTPERYSLLGELLSCVGAVQLDDADSKYAFLVLVATAIELAGDEAKRLLAREERDKTPIWKTVNVLCSVRDSRAGDQAGRTADVLFSGLKDAQVDMIRTWMRREIDFVREKRP